MLYHILAEKYKNLIDWGKVDFFWGDERYVPFEDDRNNAKMAFECLLNPLEVPSENVFPMGTTESPITEATKYQDLLKNYFRETSRTFDFTLLGLGSDAHTLSLFPKADLVLHHQGWVTEAFNKKEGLKRITLLPEVVNASGCIAFLVQGSGKADAIQKTIFGNYDPLHCPAQLIRAEKGRLLWYMDRAAGQKIAGIIGLS